MQIIVFICSDHSWM